MKPGDLMPPRVSPGIRQALEQMAEEREARGYQRGWDDASGGRLFAIACWFGLGMVNGLGVALALHLL